MPKTKKYTNLEIVNEIDDNQNNIFKINTFENQKVIEWINKHEYEFQKTKERRKKVNLILNNNSIIKFKF